MLSLCFALLQEFDIDTERLPLGTLSKDQVQRGYNVLERLRSALNGNGDSLERLSSEFYQVPVDCCLISTTCLDMLDRLKFTPDTQAGKQQPLSCYLDMQLPICICTLQHYH